MAVSKKCINRNKAGKVSNVQKTIVKSTNETRKKVNSAIGAFKRYTENIHSS